MSDKRETCPACDGSGKGAADCVCNYCNGVGGVSGEKAARARQLIRQYETATATDCDDYAYSADGMWEPIP